MCVPHSTNHVIAYDVVVAVGIVCLNSVIMQQCYYT